MLCVSPTQNIFKGDNSSAATISFGNHNHMMHPSRWNTIRVLPTTSNQVSLSKVSFNCFSQCFGIRTAVDIASGSIFNGGSVISESNCWVHLLNVDAAYSFKNHSLIFWLFAGMQVNGNSSGLPRRGGVLGIESQVLKYWCFFGLMCFQTNIVMN